MLSLILASALSLTDPVPSTVTVTTDRGPLEGTLLRPDGEARAAAVIIAGSGPTDRDGNAVALGLNGGTYRLLAEGLAAEGVAVVRYDKRGVGASAGAAPPEEELRFQDSVDDARLWVAATVRETGQDCAWIIGHSEGAHIAAVLAAEDDAQVCGLVLLSGAGRPASVVLREQLTASPLPEPLKGQALAAVDELAAGRLVANPPAGLEALFRPSVQPYLISWLPLDPAVALKAYDGPVFIGQGTTDIQTTVADAQGLAAARPDARLVLWEGVNHLLKVAPLERTANSATYSNPSLPLADGVVADVAEFILSPR